MKGKRKYPDEDGELWLAEGEYGQDRNGRWLARPPGSHTGSLENHDVTVHDDETITVSPSIAIFDEDHRWHGYLKAGEWREA